jgi:hypothetical protein
MPHVLWHDTATGIAVQLIDLSPSYVIVQQEPETSPAC